MELRDFISDAIEQIAQGIKEASNKCKELGVIVNPDVTVGENGDYSIPKHPSQINIVRRVQILKIDVAVTVQNSTENNAGGKFSVSVLVFGGKHTSGNANIRENRLQFSIPVCFPTENVEEVVLKAQNYKQTNK